MHSMNGPIQPPFSSLPLPPATLSSKLRDARAIMMVILIKNMLYTLIPNHFQTVLPKWCSCLAEIFVLIFLEKFDLIPPFEQLSASLTNACSRLKRARSLPPIPPSALGKPPRGTSPDAVLSLSHTRVQVRSLGNALLQPWLAGLPHCSAAQRVKG